MKWQLIIILMFCIIMVNAQLTTPTQKETVKYTYNSKVTEKDGIGNAIIYSGMKYADSKGTTIEKAYSLKDCEFCDRINLEIDYDEKYPLQVIDYNYSSIKIEFHTTDENAGKLVPLEIYDKENISNKYEESYVLIPTTNDRYNATIQFGFDKIIKFGEGSTTVLINTTSTGTGNVRAGSAPWDDVHDAVTGGFVDVSGDFYLDISHYPGTPDNFIMYRGFFPFNISDFPESFTIDYAELRVKIYWTDAKDDDGLDYLAVVGDTTQNSVYTLITADWNDCGSVNNPTIYSNTIDISDTGDDWYIFIINEDGKDSIVDAKSGDNWVRWGIRQGHDIEDEAPNDDEYATVDRAPDPPYVNITYSEGAPPSDCWTVIDSNNIRIPSGCTHYTTDALIG